MSDALVLADEYWDYYRNTAQFWNIDRGDVDQIELWEDLSPVGVGDRIRRLGDFAARAERTVLEGSAPTGMDALSEHERTLLAALSFSARSTASLLPYERDLTLVAAPMNLATFLSMLVPGYVLTTHAHGVGYVAKLQSFPEFVHGWIAGLGDGLTSGRVATTRGIATAVAQFDAILETDLGDDPLVGQAPPLDATPAEADAWRNDVLSAVGNEVRPALVRLRDFLGNELSAAGRPDERAGICHLPGGADDYQALLRASTSTNLSPEAIHQLGWEHLATLHEEYRRLGPDALGLDDPAQIRERLRTDTSFRYATGDEVVAEATALLARAVEQAPLWFNRLPRSACAAVAAGAGGMAFYTGPSPDGARGGRFFVSTSEPARWTRYSLPVTTFHESVPGHHLQVALAQELGLHPILGELEVTSYGEGWGLYAERLADEMGLYRSPLQRIGMLTLDSLRSARLVVDTGVHAFGWTRQEAIDFLVRTTALELTNAEAEIDRYIAAPAQATSYMIGRIEIQRLRRHAAASLGPLFAVPDFHDVVLGSGMMPLTELARTVDTWIASLSGNG